MNQSMIVRAKTARFAAGDIVYQAGQVLAGEVLVYAKADPANLVWLRGQNLLARSQFLRRQPTRRFYFLADQKLFHSDNYYFFLEDVTDLKFGYRPFRFESFGEVVYFLRQRGLESDRFLIGNMTRYPTLTTSYSLKKTKHEYK